MTERPATDDEIEALVQAMIDAWQKSGIDPASAATAAINVAVRINLALAKDRSTIAETLRFVIDDQLAQAAHMNIPRYSA